MARQTVVTMIDDVTGVASEDVREREFAFDGKAYEIDLSDESFGAFSELLAPYVASARKATVSAPRPGGKRSGSGKVSSNPDKARNQAARAWAVSQGREVAERGRLGRDVIEAWEAAGSPMPSGESAPAATPSEATPVDSSAGVPAAGSAEAEQASADEVTPRRSRKGRAASTTPTRPDAVDSSADADAQAAQA